MASLQIRLQKEGKLWDVAQDVILHIEEAFLHHPDVISPRPGQLYTLTQVVVRQIDRAVESYGVCGAYTRCHAASKPASILPEQQRPADRHDHLRLLKEGIDHLATRLAADVFDQLCPQAKVSQWLALIPKVDHAIHTALGPLLYENPFCRNCPSCTPECRRNAWEGDGVKTSA